MSASATRRTRRHRRTIKARLTRGTPGKHPAARHNNPHGRTGHIFSVHLKAVKGSTKRVCYVSSLPPYVASRALRIPRIEPMFDTVQAAFAAAKL